MNVDDLLRLSLCYGDETSGLALLVSSLYFHWCEVESSGVEILKVLDGRIGADGRLRERLVADLRLPVEPAHGPLLRQLQVQQDSDVLARVVLQEQELQDASPLAEPASPVLRVERLVFREHFPGGALEVEVKAAKHADDRFRRTVEEARGAAHHFAAGEGTGGEEMFRRWRRSRR